MLILNGENWELSQIGKEPVMGYSDEYIEKTMISGMIRRIYLGRRFYANFYYGFFTPEQTTKFEELLKAQRKNGYITAIISNPYGSFDGKAIIDLNENQRRFSEENNVWLDWSVSLKSLNLDKNDI